MWIARNNNKLFRGGVDDYYVVCTQYPTMHYDKEGVVVQFLDNSGITYAKVSPSIFEALHPEAKLEPGEGPYWCQLTRAEWPREAGYAHPKIFDVPKGEG